MLNNTEKKKSIKLGFIICSIAALFYCYEFVLRATPGIMLLQLMETFRVNAHSIGLLASSYYLLYTPLQIPAGMLVDRYGPKCLLSCSILLCTIGCFIMAKAHTLSTANHAQIMLGAGSAIAFIGSLKLAKNWLPKKYFSITVGIITTLGMIGAISTNSLLIKLMHYTSWRILWKYLGIIGIILSLLMFSIIKNAPSYPNNRKLLKKITSKKHLICSWNNLFKQILIIIRNKTFILNALIGSFLFLPIMIIGTLWGVKFLVDSYAFTNNTAGTINSMLFIGMSIGAPLFAWLANTYTNKLSLLKFSCLTSSLLLFFILSTNHLSILNLDSLFLILGLLLGAEILVFDLATELIDKKFAGTAVAITNAIIMLPEMFISPWIGKLLDHHAPQQLFIKKGYELLHFPDYQVAFLAMPILLLTAFFIVIYLDNSKTFKQIIPV